MAGSIVGFSQASDGNKPSAVIWADCPNSLLNDKSLGYYYFQDFLGGAVSAATLASLNIVPGMSFDGDTDTVTAYKASELGGYLDTETDADDNDAFAFHTEPLGTITRNSGKKLWFEARFELGDVTMDGACFLGLVEEAGASRDVIADDCAALIGESYIGFRVFTNNPDALDIAYKKDGGTEVEVLADATNATAIASGDRANLVNDTEVKIGIRFDGRDTLRFFINGIQVATQDVDTTIDQSKNYVAIFALKTGTGAAESIALDWLRVAVQDKSG